jgi:Zinc finger, C2H2 type
LPSQICHKCLVSVENFIEFRDKVIVNDTKLKSILSVNEVSTAMNEDTACQYEDNEIVKLDPNKIYESDDESEINETVTPLEVAPKEDKKIDKKVPVQRVNNDSAQQKKKEVYHCKYCDIVFSDSTSCILHENVNHDQQFPYECNICPSKFNQHPALIIHIKTIHGTDKPYYCVVCQKTFLRRSDLRKHVFVHAGIRLFTCNICTKSFTRKTNLAKHKKSHDEVQKNFKCSLCPKAYASNAELSRHMAIHMNLNTLNCKFCNQVFDYTQRQELEIHQKSHIAVPPKVPVQPSAMLFNQNSNMQQYSVPNPAPMNFYTENPEVTKTIEYPIMAQPNLQKLYKCDKCIEQFPTMQQLQTHQTLYHSKNFTCGVCNNAYYKKKELDRHILSTHTDVKYNCSKCTKSFSRKDKLLRHEKIHLIPSFFNCPLCPAVFIRKHLLDLHAKIHELPNSNPKLPSNSLVIMDLPQQPMSNSLLSPIVMSESFLNQMQPMKQLPELIPLKMTEQPAILYPMNLSLNQQLNEPMDLSNDKQCYDEGVTITKIEAPKIVIDSDDDDLKIIHVEGLNNGTSSQDFSTKTDNLSITTQMQHLDKLEAAKIEEMAFRMSSRLVTDLDKLEPSKDLPIEILQSPDL